MFTEEVDCNIEIIGETKAKYELFQGSSCDISRDRSSMRNNRRNISLTVVCTNERFSRHLIQKELLRRCLFTYQLFDRSLRGIC